MKNINKKIKTAKRLSYLALIIVSLMLLPSISAGAVFQEPSNLTTPLQSIGYIVGLTDVGAGAMFGTIIYFLITMALFMGMKSYTNDRAAAVALFISSIVGIILRIFGWLNDAGVYLALILMIVALFNLWNKND